MRKILIILIINILLVGSCFSQINNLNDNELFDGVKFNNITLRNIMNSKGNLSNLKNSIGNDLVEKPNRTGFHSMKYIYNNNISFGFKDETDSGNNYYLSSVRVKNQSVSVAVKNVIVKLGDSKTKLSNFQYNTSYGGYVFVDKDTGSVSLSFKINRTTNTISEITYTNF